MEVVKVSTRREKAELGRLAADSTGLSLACSHITWFPVANCLVVAAYLGGNIFLYRMFCPCVAELVVTLSA